MSFIFIVLLRTWKNLTPKDITAVKGLTTKMNCWFGDEYDVLTTTSTVAHDDCRLTLTYSISG
jgi:hypothetical protein